ncbi:MAG: taurine dioxygenase [Rhizomicrobium sp.]|jgi:taurine dioxygenase
MTAKSILRISPQSPTLGARIEGIDLARPISDEIVTAIRQALLDHEVLFFEDQDLTPAQQRNFAARFGRLHVHPIRPSVPGLPEVLVLDNEPASETDNGNWRTDVTFIETPPMGSVLYAKEIPPLGGDTIWSSMRAAYNGLSEPFRNFLATLEAEHDFARSFPPNRTTALNMGAERYALARREHPPVAHPVVRSHPETGHDGLFVNSGFTTRILGISQAESEKILELLSEHIQRPEYIVRWTWKPNSLVFWDNRVTQHYTVNDYLPHRRVMHRATILGDRPFNRSQRPKKLAAA